MHFVRVFLRFMVGLLKKASHVLTDPKVVNRLMGQLSARLGRPFKGFADVAAYIRDNPVKAFVVYEILQNAWPENVSLSFDLTDDEDVESMRVVEEAVRDRPDQAALAAYLAGALPGDTGMTGSRKSFRKQSFNNIFGLDNSRFSDLVGIADSTDTLQTGVAQNRAGTQVAIELVRFAQSVYGSGPRTAEAHLKMQAFYAMPHADVIATLEIM